MNGTNLSYYIHNLSPIAFEIGPFVVPWYWLVYFLGYIGTYLSLDYFVEKSLLKLSKKDIYDYMLWGSISLLLGGRLVYVFLYNFDYFLEDWRNVYRIWQGGMSFHGALLGVSLSVFIVSKIKKQLLFTVTDAAVYPLSLCLMFGRIANFINGELAGRPTDVFWAVIFPKFYDQQPRHPSQLYEAFLEGFVLFCILLLLRKKREINGFLSFSFLTLYGVFRFFIEFFRMPDHQLGLYFNFFSMGQILCSLMIMIGIFFLVKKSFKK